MLKILTLVICMLTFATAAGILAYLMTLGVFSAALVGIVFGSAGAVTGQKITKLIKA